MTSTVSCIIPTHGRPEYLEEALASVADQRSRPYEIIVVSDDGDERSRRIVDAVRAREQIQITYVHNVEGQGASSSRNLGASRAGGSHLAFLDDDDLWDKNYLADVFRVLETDPPAECVVTWLEMFRGDRRVPGLMMRERLKPRDVAAINPGFTGSNFVVRAEAFHDIGGFDSDLRVINDGDFIFRYLKAGHTYRVNKQHQVKQRKHETGQLTAATEMRAQGLEKYLAKHSADLRLRDRRYMRLAIHRIRYHVASGRGQKLRYLLLGLANATPRAVWISITGLGARDVWRAK